MAFERTKKQLQTETRDASKNVVEHVKKFAPAHIAPHIHARSTYSGDTSTITIYVKKINKQQYGTMDAAAQEYGSGVHADYRHTYVITPKKKKVLSFYWEKVGDVVAFKKVNHPGIPPYQNTGYMRIGVDAWKFSPEGRAKISRGYRSAINADIKDSLGKLMTRFKR